MSFPLEIIFQIAEYFVETELCHQYTELDPLITESDFWESFLTCQGPICLPSWEEIYGYSTSYYTAVLYQDALNLRLVSRNWHAAVTRLLRQHHVWKVKFDKKFLQRAVQWGKSPQAGTSAFVGLHHSVRSLDVLPIDKLRTFTRRYTYETEYPDDFDVDEDKFLGHYEDDVYKNMDDDKLEPVVHYDIASQHALFRQLIDKLGSIESFKAILPPAASEHDNGYLHEADCYDMQGLDETMASFQYALKSPAFGGLVDLRLGLPSVWHMVTLAEVLPQSTRDQLKHLGLSVVDSTGPGGDPACHGCDGEHEYPDGDMTLAHVSGFPPSNVQVAVPDRKHTDKLWSFISSCRNLETLGLEGTRYLELDKLQWSPAPGSRGLRSVLLKRMWVDADTIIRLLAGPPGSEAPPALQRILLNNVKLYANGGNWEDVFAYLLKECPNLEFFQPYQLTYWSSHDRYKSNNRIWENCDTVWTSEVEEHRLLEMVIKRCMEKLDGKTRYPEMVSFRYVEA